MRKFYNSCLFFVILICLSATSCSKKYTKNSTISYDSNSIKIIEDINGKVDSTIIIRDLTSEQNAEPIYEKDVFGREEISRWVYVYHTNSGEEVYVTTWNQNFIQDIDTDGNFVIITYKNKDGETKIFSVGDGHFYIGKQRGILNVSTVGPFSFSNSTSRSGNFSKETTNSIHSYSNAAYRPWVRISDGQVKIDKFTLLRNGVVDTAEVTRCQAYMKTIKDTTGTHRRYKHTSGSCPIDNIVLYENGIVDTATMIAYMNIAE